MRYCPMLEGLCIFTLYAVEQLLPIFMFGVHNHRFTLTMKISSFYIPTVKMSVIFEKINPFCIMYEVIEIFENLIKILINLCHQKPNHC